MAHQVPLKNPKSDKKELEELDKDQYVHHNGEVEELYLDLQENKTLKSSKTRKIFIISTNVSIILMKPKKQENRK